jgi:ArsR family transcriptional regulator
MRRSAAAIVPRSAVGGAVLIRVELDTGLAIWQISQVAKGKIEAGNALRAISNARRLQVLEWLKHPRRHFPPQVDGDLVRDGVCGVLIARKLGVSSPTLSEHMRVLTAAGLVRGKRIKQWTFYKRNEARIREVRRMVASI